MSIVRVLAAHRDETVGSVPSGKLQVYKTVAAARGYFPDDTIVWVNTETAAVHRPGSRWYGKTRRGGYTGERDAEF